MGNVFSASEVVEIGIEIEKNGRDFYNGVKNLSKNPKVKELFEFLAGEEAKHIKRFEAMLSEVKKYDPSEAYPGEYFAYIRSLSEGHIFTKKNNGAYIAKTIKDAPEAIEFGIRLEKDSILFYEWMKKLVLEGEQKVIDRLIGEEQEHFLKLSELKKIL